MAAHPKTAPDHVARCVPRQDGGWLVVTRKGQSGSSPLEIPEGRLVIIRDGVVQKVNHG